MKKINGPKTLEGKYELKNRSDYLNKLEDLRKQELVTRFGIKFSNEENNAYALDRFTRRREKIIAEMKRLHYLLGRDSNIRMKYINYLEEIKEDQLNMSYDMAIAIDSGDHKTEKALKAKMEYTQMKRRKIEEKLRSDKVYLKDEIEEENNKKEETKKSNETLRKIGIYIRAAFIALGRTSKESMNKLKDIFRSFKMRNRMLEEPKKQKQYPIDEKNIIQWSSAEEKAIRDLGNAKKNDTGLIYSGSKEEKREDFKLRLENESKPMDNETLYFSSEPEAKKEEKDNLDDGRDIG